MDCLAENNGTSLKNINTNFYKIFDKSTPELFEIITTSSSINKYIYGLKHNKKETKLKQLVTQNNYGFILMETHINFTRIQIQQLKNYIYQNEMVLQNFNNYKSTNTLTHEKMGKIGEEFVFDIIKFVFNCDIFKSKWKFTKWDFASNIFYLFEFKWRNILSTQYKTAFINECKTKIYDNLIFIWRYIDGLFYLSYNKELFDTFVVEWRQTDYQKFPQAVMLIPHCHLIKIDITSIIHLPKIIHTTIFSNLIEEDVNFYKLQK